MSNGKSFEDLHCWQAAYEVKELIRLQILPKFPKDEKYDLYDQLRRASRSATANIAEGWGRYHFKDNIKFLLNARGSLAECKDHGIEALNWDYIDSACYSKLASLIESALKLCNGYIRFLNSRLKENNMK